VKTQLLLPLNAHKTLENAFARKFGSSWVKAFVGAKGEKKEVWR